jgi:zinc protease
MAFNGSTNIPEGQLLPMLERLGLAFGADTNATTTIDYTTYKLQLPRTDDATVDTALKVMRETAGNLLFDPAAVDRERGIMLSEAQVRNNPQRRQLADYLEAALPGSRIGPRAGFDQERIRNISAADLKAFYHAFYRPERATLVIVGDFDVDAMQAKVEATFTDWQGQGPARDIYAGPVPATDSPVTIGTFVDPAAPEFIRLQRIAPWEPSQNTATEQQDQLLRAVAGAALSNRINALARAADSPTLGGGAAEEALFRSARSYGLSIVAKDGQWRETLALAERELRRADQFGFTAAEIAEIKANIATSLENAVTQAPGRSSVALAEGLVAASLEDAVWSAPDFMLAFYRAIEPSLTPEAVSAAFRAAWQGRPSVVHVSTKQPIEGDTGAIVAVLAESAAVAVTAPTEAAAVQFAYGDWGAPGKVVSDTTVADLGIRTLRFANGLQLNLKRTNFEPGKVAFALRIGDGLAAFPANRQGLSSIIPLLAGIDGLKAHDADELRRVLAGKAVSLGLGADEGAVIADGQTTPADLDLQLDLLAARLTATAWRPETQAQWAAIAPAAATNLRADASQVLNLALPALFAGGDARLGLTDFDQFNAVSLNDLRVVIGPQLESGPLALGLVGDFDADAAIAAVAASLGALPARPDRREPSTVATPLAFASEPALHTLIHTGKPDQGAIALGWQTDDGDDLRDDLTRDVLAEVIDLRLTEVLREELGTTYSPVSISFSQRTFPGFGYLTAYATVPPEAMDSAAKVIRDIAAELATKPVDADLLERARNPIRTSYDRAESQNGSWLGVVAGAQSDPAALDRWRSRKGILDGMTPADIQSAARRYLAGKPPVEIRVVPQTK